MTYKFDTITVLGSMPDPATWEFPDHVYDSLDKAADLLQQTAAPSITLSGKWALSLERQGLVQPFNEADKMAEYLRANHGVATSSMYVENNSKDTIANLYELKQRIYEPLEMRRILMIVADYRLPRLFYLTHQILGDKYDVILQGVPTTKSGLADSEARAFARQYKFLHDMTPGEDHWLDGRFYDDPYYRALLNK